MDVASHRTSDPFLDREYEHEAFDPPSPSRVIIGAWSRGIFGGTLAKGMVVYVALMTLTVLAFLRS